LKLFPFSRAHEPIGLDISGRWIKAAQVSPSRSDSHKLGAAARLTRADAAAPFSPADADLVAGVLERLGFEGHQVVLVAPRDMLYTDVLELPPRSSGAPIDQLARMELARSNRCDPDSFELGLWDLPAAGRGGGGAGPEGSHVFAVGLPHEKSEPLISALEGAGFDVVAIDTPGCAIARACLPLRAQAGASHTSLTAILEVGWHSALLIVACGGADGVVVYERSIVEAGLCRLFAAVRARLGLEEAALDLLLSGAAPTKDSGAHPLLSEARGCITEFLEGLIPEVQRSLSYTAHRYQGWTLSRLLVTGDGADLIGLCERLAPAATVPVHKARLPDVLTLGPKTESHDHAATTGGSLFAAAGASLHACHSAAGTTRRAA
jgi:Tfp pilus assembly PilM family ATPase